MFFVDKDSGGASNVGSVRSKGFLACLDLCLTRFLLFPIDVESD